ncbi:hypothetical protein [Streptomyces sp. SID3343]|uniref:hypothetical protein n=1 Tax=Streptomyces sp. SID3343 TaxID=2690260 RepID=UPI00136C3C60|nr:hypothetical protein [Streptomyces sp. SID3343]MYW00008.1 hypothetical protein [Streptomyces sp. SID3343]
MDFADVDVLLVTDLGVEIQATADIWDWYPPDSPRPAGAPLWSAMVAGSTVLTQVMSVGSGGDLRIDATGELAGYGVVAVYEHAAELRGRGTVTP